LPAGTDVAAAVSLEGATMPYVTRSGRDTFIRGFILQAVGGGFWCWDQYKSRTFVGKRSQSEIFPWASMFGRDDCRPEVIALRWAEKHGILGAVAKVVEVRGEG
jgi:hypothetical protein